MRDRLVELLSKFIKTCKQNCTGIEKSCYMCTLEQLADHILADGWMRPPCKVGDKVYYISENPLNLSVQANTIYEADVVRIVTTYLGTSLVIQIHNEYGCTEIPDVNDWGKTVFLTKEEAEQALGGGKSER